MSISKRGKLILFFALGTFVMIYFMSVTGRPLKTPATPHGILDLEFAYSKIKVVKVISAWNGPLDHSFNRIAAARINTYLDFLFLLFYSPFLFLTCKLLIKKYNRDMVIYKTGKLIASGSLLAGFFDIMENLGMLQSLNGNITDTIATFTFVSSLIKWVMVILALLFIITMLLYKLILTRFSKFRVRSS